MADTLQFQNVSKSYHTSSGPIEALRDFSLQIAEGEFISIVGPSGCGKSTLLSMASGLAFPTNGTILANGNEITKPVTELGIVFQTDVLLDWRSVLDNVLIQPEMRGLDRKAYEDRARSLLDKVGLGGFEKKFPYELSGGMRQRVSICRALIHEPPILLMDEPFGALDALTREQMVMELHQIWLETQKSVIFITHDIQEAVLLADRVVVMTPRPGRIAEIIKTDLPHPRRPGTMESQQFVNTVARVRHLFEQHGVLKAY
ncbi:MULTISPECIES: ABC transporter ATP-binding protein [Limibacillus]|jgi:NitT/TauT family transport system ATP-binding protein|uniref:NitT/TauT family transport system ATP-binding protein n=1 Tax=Limibacillus halophilus TaxID=1579333 RepID=A0A839SLR0_9PROT|nr:ABC transporter ATP-binding protein [Limibacillus halophilus]MBB3063761.1 NitT/TauT family transport system ATP-binding protein [Limibacillus halophilus]